MSSFDAVSDADFGVVREGYNSAPAILKTNPGISEKQRVLSARAASMLVICCALSI